ncbi:MAG: penicillin-binding protein activator [Thiotrichaceae bacterium]|nr:penicillin-binding protein activator [Thiotrichaceae bacterium]
MNKLLLCYLFFISILLSGCVTKSPNYPIPSATPSAIPAATKPVVLPEPNLPTLPATAVNDKIRLANQLYKQGLHREAADTYYHAGLEKAPPTRNRLILQAIEIAAIIPDTSVMQHFYKAINSRHLSNENTARYNYTKALLALLQKQPNIALDILQQSYPALPAGLQKKIEQTRQQARSQLKPVVTQPATPAPSSTNNNSNSNKAIAVLLPRQGAIRQIGAQLFEGIHTAARTHSATGSLKLMDSAKLDSTVLYNQAIEKGVSFVIGPFAKSNIISIAKNGNLPVPVLSLNYIPTGSKKPSNLYEFGLLPEDEAVQVASQIANKGLKKALLVIPNSAWGQRIEKAFGYQYHSQGGIIHKTLRYPNKSSQYKSLSRSIATQNNHVDIIFFAGSPRQAKQIYPIIRSNNRHVPVYATSHIYSGKSNSVANQVLDGIKFTEIPYILEHPINRQNYPRLYALGLDAYRITQQFTMLKNGQSITGNTGKIKMQRNGQFHRTLQWASFKNGHIVRSTP